MAKQLNMDSDNEEFDCDLRRIPSEHLPLFQHLASINGKINRMKRRQLIDTMNKKKLNVNGELEVLKKRLKNHYRMKTLIKAKICESEFTYFPYYVVIDIEATCTEDNPPDYKYVDRFEIIEFPAVLVDAKKRKIVDHFQSFVKPSINPILSEFCIKLTGITQNQVDTADPFPVCLTRFTKWLDEHKLGTEHRFSIVTDGSFDMARFLYGQCIMSGIPYPEFAFKWINIRKIFRSFYFTKQFKCNLNGMLTFLHMEFEGNPHSGLDDSYNISRICIRLLEDGAFVDQNERIVSLKNPTPFGKDDPLPVRPVHNIFCDGMHNNTYNARSWQLHSRMKNLQLDKDIANKYS